MREHIVGHADQSIFFYKHLSVLAYDSQTVDIRVYDKSHIGFTLTQEVTYLGQVFGKRFRIMRKMACRFAVETNDILHTQSLQHSRYGDAAYRVDAVDGYGKVAFSNGLCMHERQG